MLIRICSCVCVLAAFAGSIFAQENTYQYSRSVGRTRAAIVDRGTSSSATADPDCSLIKASSISYLEQYSYGDDYVLAAILADGPAARTIQNFKCALDITRGPNISKLLFLTVGYKKFLQEAENIRTDKQTGAAPSSQGTTSVVSKGVSAQVLSLATEQGALTRTDSKTTSTFQANALGIARLITGAELFPYCAIYDYRCESFASRALRGLSAGVSFYTAPSSNNSTSSSATSTNNSSVLNASTRNVAGWNVRYDFHVRRDLKEMASGYQTEFKKQYPSAGSDAAAFLLAIEKITNPLLLPPPTQQSCPQNLDPKAYSLRYLCWEEEYALKLTTANAADFNQILLEAVTDLENLTKQADSNFQADAENLLSKMTTYFGSRDGLLSKYVNKITYSIEYEDDRPTNQPTQSTAKFIVSANPKGFQFTGNASIQWYDQILHSNVSRVRDGQAALQFDKKFGGSTGTISPTLSAGYYFQYMVGKALLTLPSTQFAPGTTIPLPGSASELLNTTGSIHLGQVKLTLSIKNTGINFPIALTFSNRTDLIKATDVRGNFGVTYDLDSLFVKK